MDFSNKNLAILFKIGDETIYLTQTLVSTWIVMGVLILAAVVIRAMLPRFKMAPGRAQNIIEAIVEMLANFEKDNLGDMHKNYGGVYFGVFLFILCSNLSGLFGIRPPTADLATTGALALITFALTQIGSIRTLKLGYLKSFIKPNPIFLPINLIGEISKPLSLAFRLFGNMLGGLIILGMIYQLLPMLLRFVLPDILHAYFDVFAGSLQAFIFTMLSMVFIRQKSTED